MLFEELPQRRLVRGNDTVSGQTCDHGFAWPCTVWYPTAWQLYPIWSVNGVLICLSLPLHLIWGCWSLTPEFVGRMSCSYQLVIDLGLVFFFNTTYPQGSSFILGITVHGAFFILAVIFLIRIIFQQSSNILEREFEIIVNTQAFSIMFSTQVAFKFLRRNFSKIKECCRNWEISLESFTHSKNSS